MEKETTMYAAPDVDVIREGESITIILRGPFKACGTLDYVVPMSARSARSLAAKLLSAASKATAKQYFGA